MARKKQEIALQAEIETQEEWEEMLAKEGVTVVDIYQDWTGPCKAMVSNFRRLKNELGDDLLRFAVAKADTVDALEAYRGKCQPCFTLFAGGVLVAVVRGCNAPLLLKTITEQLSHEHKVLEGKAERKEVRDPMLAAKAAKEKQEEEEEEEEEEQKKDVTVAIIKPDVVAENRVEEVLEKLKESGIEVLEHIERTLTEEEAREFYAHRKEEEYFEGLIQFMTSGPSHLLVLTKGDTGEGIIEEWRELLGPASVEEAKEQAPDSLRAQFGKESYVNALHGSDSKDTAMKELAFFFPDFAVPTVPGKPGKKPKVERTLALIKPEELAERKDEILGKIKEAGFTIAMVKELQLTKEQAEEFYSEHREQEYFEGLTTTMSTGPIIALALAREDAVAAWKKLSNPEGDEEDSLLKQYSNQGVTLTLHGSETQEAAKKELDYIFPMQKTMAVIKPDAYQTKDEIMGKIKEAGFHIAARKETDLSREVAEQFYQDLNDKEYYGDLVEHMTSGPTLFMVLSREDAVEGWRSLIGPTDPEKAREDAPESLRALFGKDIKQNAVHGSSNPEHAKKNMQLLFEDGEITEKEEEAQEEAQSEPSRQLTQAESEGEQGEKREEPQPETQQEGEAEPEGEGQDTGERPATQQSTLRPQTQEKSRPQTQEKSRPQTQDKSRPQTQDKSRPQTQEKSRPQTQDKSRPQTQEKSRPQTQEKSRPQTRESHPEGETQPETQEEQEATPETQETQEEAQPQQQEQQAGEEQATEQQPASEQEPTGEQEATGEQEQQQPAEEAGSGSGGDEGGEQEPAQQQETSEPTQAESTEQQEDKPAEPEQSQEEKPAEPEQSQEEAKPSEETQEQAAEPEQSQEETKPEEKEETQAEQQETQEQSEPQQTEEQEPAQQSDEQQPAEASEEQKPDESSEEAKPAETSEEQAETTEEQNDEEQKE